jgi:hypothetical protein
LHQSSFWDLGLGESGKSGAFEGREWFRLKNEACHERVTVGKMGKSGALEWD